MSIGVANGLGRHLDTLSSDNIVAFQKVNRRPFIWTVQSTDIKTVLLRGECTLRSKPGFFEVVRHILHQGHLSHRHSSDLDLDSHRGHTHLGILFNPDAAVPVRHAEGMGYHRERMHRSKINMGLYQRGKHHTRRLPDMAAFYGGVESAGSTSTQARGDVVFCGPDPVSLSWRASQKTCTDTL